MHRTLLASLAFALVMALPQALAASPPPVPVALRVVADNNYPPYLFVDNNGRADGYLADLWRLWELKTGVPVELRPMQWSAAQRVMRDGGADVIDMLFRTPERERVYDFSAPYATLDASIYVGRSFDGLHDVRSMAGMAVGVQDGDACVDILRGQGIASLHVYPNYGAMLAAARAEEIKVFCMDDGPANYYMYLNRDHQRFAKAFTLYSGEFHRAVRKGGADTLALVERGMAAITPAEQAALQRKWFAKPVAYLPFMSILAYGVPAVLVLLGAALLWIRALRRAVRVRTSEVTSKNEQLEQAARALLADQAQLRSLFEGSPDAMALKDCRLVYQHCNREFELLAGRPREDILGHTDDEIFGDAGFVALIRARDEEVIRYGRACRSDQAVLTRDGVERHLEVIKVPIRGIEGRVTGVLAVSRDITARRQAERELRVAAVAFESQDGLMITDGRGVIERVNSAFSRITGFSEEEALGQRPRFLQSGLHERDFYVRMWEALARGGYWSGEVVNRRKGGELFSARLSITAVADAHGRTMHYVGHFQDISAVKEARALAERLERFDQLTGLPNRAQFSTCMAAAVGERAHLEEFGALMMLDLDHFQRVNDSLGHMVGDQLLVKLAQRLQAVRRDGDVLARFSGDSFVLLCESLGPDRVVAVTRAMAIAEAARRAMADQLVLQGQRFDCSGTVGVTLFHDDSAGADVLLRQAELAMYKGKQDGRDTVRFFEGAMQARFDERNWLEGALREAIEQGQLELFYQIQVDQDGRPSGAEALVRWRHPQRGLIPPGAFIGLAEETGLILPIGRWALETACRQLSAWKGRPVLEDLALAVNISPLQFRAESFVDEVLAAVRAAGVEAGMLKLEVTESLAIDDFQSSISKLNALKSHGFSISLDDFGTGNSSLNYLTKLPLTQLKIDKSFVDELPDSQRDAMVAQTIIAMGQGLGLDVIAEGVETAAQRDFLLAHGCHAFQGYLFGKPLPAAEFEAMVMAAAAPH